MILGVREEETVGLSGSVAPVSDREENLCDTTCWFRIKVLYGCSTAFECEIFRDTSIGIILCRLRNFSQVETNDDMGRRYVLIQGIRSGSRSFAVAAGVVLTANG